METIYAFEIQIILFLQSLGGGPQSLFKAITFFGNEQFYLLVAPALYWCISMEAGLRMGIFLGITSSINTYIKFLFHAPRPYWLTTQVHPLVSENSFGLPSGHAQHAVMIFGSLLRTYRYKWLVWLVVAIAFLVGLSRLFIAVHFPSDVLVGWLIGAVLLWASLKTEPLVVAWIKQQAKINQYLTLLSISLAIILVGWVIRWLFSAWQLPAEWAANAASAFPDEPPLDPFKLSGLVTLAGSFFGLTGGAIFLASQGIWRTQGSPLQLVARYFIGLAGLLVLYFGLDFLFLDGNNVIAFIFRYVRYAMTGFWVSALAPLIFRKLKLAD